MNIAYFNAMLDKGHDGVTRVVFSMIDGALERGHHAIGISATVPQEEDRNVDFVGVLSIPLPWQKIYRIAVPGYQTFARKLLAFKPDIIHINSPCTLGFAAMQFAHRFDIPVVATYHTHFPTYARYYNLPGTEEAMWTIMRTLYNHIDRTFVPSVDIMTELQAHKFKTVSHCSNGINLKLFNPSFRSDAWRKKVGAENKPVLLFVSRLVWEKDLRDLAETYKMLRAARNDFQMVIVGDGHAREEFQSMMPDAVFLGYQSGRELSECYASSDIFLFPSTTETFGLVTVEAMASGAVPVAARAGGASNIIEHDKSGMITTSHKPEEMAREVARLLDDPARRSTLSHGAIARAKEFGWEKILDGLFAQYHEVIAMHPKKKRIVERMDLKRREIQRRRLRSAV